MYSAFGPTSRRVSDRNWIKTLTLFSVESKSECSWTVFFRKYIFLISCGIWFHGNSIFFWKIWTTSASLCAITSVSTLISRRNNASSKQSSASKVVNPSWRLFENQIPCVFCCVKMSLCSVLSESRDFSVLISDLVKIRQSPFPAQ